MSWKKELVWIFKENFYYGQSGVNVSFFAPKSFFYKNFSKSVIIFFKNKNAAVRRKE